ncbi:MAG TPA: hydroxyphenylacetyl-CoA thioesterase PaaI [Gemmatimonadaceae bacterium]
MSGAREGGEEQRRAERLVGAMLERDAFSAWLGIEVLEVRPGGCRTRMRVRDDMLNGFGVCHGGVTFSLADSALAFASNTHGRVTVSVENAIGYPAPVRAGDVLEASAVEESAGRRMGYYRVTVRNQDDVVVALFRGTVYRTNKELLPEAGAEREA